MIQLLITLFFGLLLAFFVLSGAINLLFFCGLVAFLIFLSRPLFSKVYLLLIATIVLFDKGVANQYFSLSKFGLNLHILDIMYLTIFIHFIFECLSKKIKCKWAPEYFFLYLFFLFVFISIFRPPYDLPLKSSFYAARELFYYGIPIVVFSILDSHDKIKKLLDGLVLGTVMYSLLIISLYLVPNNPLAIFDPSQVSWAASRIGFRNHQAYILALPLCLVWALSRKNPASQRLMYGIYFSAGIFLIIIGQTRSLMIFSVILLVLSNILIFNRRTILRPDFKAPIFLGSFALISILMLFFIVGTPSHGILGPDLRQRFESFSQLGRDKSVKFREQQFEHDKVEMKKYFLFGQGMRAFYKDAYQGRPLENIFFDNSNTLFIRKVGFVGYASLLLFIFFVSIKLYYCYRYSADFMAVSVSAAFLSIIPCAAINSFITAYLVQYKIIIVYSILFGVIQAMRELDLAKPSLSGKYTAGDTETMKRVAKDGSCD